MHNNDSGSTSLSGLNGMNSRRRRNSSDDEEDEEIMRANGQYARHAVPLSTKSNNNTNNHVSSNHDQGNAGGVVDNSKSAAENWKGIGNRLMASQVSTDATICTDYK